MNRYRFLALPGYCIAAFLIIVPFMDTIISTMPLSPTIVGWRFGTLGLLANAFMTPLVGLFILLALAAALDQRRVLRVLAVLSVVAAVFVLGGLGLFVLDTVQMRSQVRPEAKTTFDRATVVAMAKYLFTTVVLAMVGIKGWYATRGSGRASAPVDSQILVPSSQMPSRPGT